MTLLEQCDRFLDITRNRPFDTVCSVTHGRPYHDYMLRPQPCARVSADLINRPAARPVTAVARLKPDRSSGAALAHRRGRADSRDDQRSRQLLAA